MYEISWKTKKKITVAFPLQQLLHERATVLRNTHTVYKTLTANGQAVCFLCPTMCIAGYCLHEFWPSKCKFLSMRIFLSSATLDHLTSPFSSLNLSFLQHASLIYLSSTPLSSLRSVTSQHSKEQLRTVYVG